MTLFGNTMRLEVLLNEAAAGAEQRQATQSWGNLFLEPRGLLVGARHGEPSPPSPPPLGELVPLGTLAQGGGGGGGAEVGGQYKALSSIRPQTEAANDPRLS